MKEKNSQKTRLRIQVYGSHEEDTLACIDILRKANPRYLQDPDRGPGWPSPTEVNRLAVEHFKHTFKKG